MRWQSSLKAFLVLGAWMILSVPLESRSQTNLGWVRTLRSFNALDVEDQEIVSQPNLFVPSGQTPSPFLPVARFDATWTGFLNVPLRDYYSIQCELNGAVKISVNGELVLEGNASGGLAGPSEEFRLSKGANPIVVEYTSPKQGDAWMRLQWAGYDFEMEPIAAQALTHEEAAVEDPFLQKREGRSLFLQYRCLHCHDEDKQTAMDPALRPDGPTLDGIGSRLNASWMKAWMLNPTNLRSNSRMPTLLHGEQADEEAEAIAIFLSQFKEEADSSAGGSATSGEVLFQQLNCSACHGVPGTEFSRDGNLISLEQVGWKFREGQLSRFLRQPNRYSTWTRMPDFGLTESEANDLSAYLLSVYEPPSVGDFEGSLALVDRGKHLVATKGCLQCHSLSTPQLANSFAHVPIESWQEGCLSPGPLEADRTAPYFPQLQSNLDALRAFGTFESDRLSWRRIPAEFAGRQLEELRCMNCHGQLEGVPSLDGIGGKLHVDWMNSLLHGTLDYKPRPWLSARMPAFPAYASALAEGLAHRDGHSAEAFQKPVVIRDQVEAGRKLVSATGGFACVSCHGVRHRKAAQVFESEGINLAYSGDRLRRAYFNRWLMNPMRVDPQTKMPVYFDGGKSPLFDIYDGNAEQQIEAIWQYLLLGAEMPLPD